MGVSSHVGIKKIEEVKEALVPTKIVFLHNASSSLLLLQLHCALFSELLKLDIKSHEETSL